jgi:ribosomal protein S18 acetylase RimI-like enzyme
MLEGVRGYPDETTWWIGLLALTPHVRRLGLGRKMVAGFCELARAEHRASIMLGVVEENEQAYRFWQQMGFELLRQSEPRQFGKKSHKVYVMRKVLKI